MREIFFRAKEKETGVWVEGDLVRDLDCFGENKTCIYQITGKGCWRKYFVNFETVCQYAGLTDKNGRKIFEGDILKIPEKKNHNVKFEYGQFCVGINCPIAYIRTECEVIGNIFDNPELLLK